MHLPALRAQYPYALTDQGFNLRGREFDVTVAWNVMPRVGALYTRTRTFPGALDASPWLVQHPCARQLRRRLALAAARCKPHERTSPRLLLRCSCRHWPPAGCLPAAHSGPRAAAGQQRDGGCARSSARRHGASLLHDVARTA